MKDKISIVVPIYNVEFFLKKCIDSILKQTYQNLEIILINDGSTDSSGDICDSFLEIDSRIIVIHKKNGGLSDARNAGIDASTGKYLMFIDSDDYIDNDTVELLYNGCIKSGKKISCCGKYIQQENGKYFLKNTLPKPISFDKVESLRAIFTSDKIDTSACDKLFYANLFKDIRFPFGKYYEDLATIYKVVEKSSGIYHIGMSKYHYIQRNGSILNSSFSKNKNLQYIKISKDIVDFYKDDKRLSECVYANYYLAITDSIMNMVGKSAKRTNRSTYINLMLILKDNKHYIFTNSMITPEKKIMIFLVINHLAFFAFKLRKIIKNIKNIKSKD